METIGKDHVVSIHYTLRLDSPEIVDTSVGSDPLLYLHGHGQIVPGLENSLSGRSVGEKLSVCVQAAEGYGAHDAQLCRKVSRQQFPKDATIAIGDVFEFKNPEGQRIPVRVVELGIEEVTLDANHPLAGKTLNFEIEVVSVRPATKSELEHGHAHGGDGHHH
jgi:FKBP-type peptidyl-prolyl cis-trans isomerase SlyD